jgi:hypothetical protein
MAALSVQLHAEAVTRVEVHDLGNHSVSVVFGDDRSGIRIIGDTDDVTALVADAYRLLRIAQSR